MTNSSGTTQEKYPSSAKSFVKSDGNALEYSGHLDGTLFAEAADGSWKPVEENGQVKTHVLKHMCDYAVVYKNGKVSYDLKELAVFL